MALTEEAKDLLREEKVWAFENIKALRAMIDYHLDALNKTKGHYLEFKLRFTATDRALAFEERLVVLPSKAPTPSIPNELLDLFAEPEQLARFKELCFKERKEANG